MNDNRLFFVVICSKHDYNKWLIKLTVITLISFDSMKKFNFQKNTKDGADRKQDIWGGSTLGYGSLTQCHGLGQDGDQPLLEKLVSEEGLFQVMIKIRTL